MTLMKSILTAAAVAFGMPAFAHGDISITDAYARSASASASTGAAFMVIENHADTDDRLISAASDVAKMVQLHTHVQDAAGVMHMVEVPEGFAIPAGGSHALARGGDHVMFMGLTRALNQGDVVQLTLTFENAGAMTIAVPVDLARKEMPMGQGMGMGHKHGAAPAAPGN
ncbi:MAG: copper chaperone PCu(A)C [Pseudorhodobacter sp.]|nr:copper chaperone PCu(A)C [Pseudorhodobacter sp.]